MKKFSLFFIFVLIPFLLFSKGPEISTISAEIKNQHLFIDVIMDKSFANQDVVEALNSTNPITFTYEVELLKKRYVLPSKTMVKIAFKKRVQFDNLTNQYELKVYKEEELIDKMTLTSIDDVIKELSEIKNVDLGAVVDLEPGENAYYLRARITLLKTFFLWIFPKDVDTGWMEKDLKTP